MCSPTFAATIERMKKFTVVALILLCACTSTKQVSTVSHSPKDIFINGKLFGSLYQQRAAEYRALCLQAFNIARQRVDESMRTGGNQPKAIITDIDETILDNSAYDVHQYSQGKEYEPVTWTQWIAMSKADTVPGAASFLQYAASQGVTIFYITNREEKERPGTLLNLQKFNLPNADNAHLVVRQGTSSKELRRQQVAASYNVILLLGDNLIDFSAVFEKKNLDDREQQTNRMVAEFGQRFIVIPNPVYGDWESAVYKYSNTLTPPQKDSVIKSMLKGY